MGDLERWDATDRLRQPGLVPMGEGAGHWHASITTERSAGAEFATCSTHELLPKASAARVGHIDVKSIDAPKSSIRYFGGSDEWH